MDKPIPNYWFKMTEPRLRTHLYDKLKFPPALVATLLERISAMREERRVKAIKRTVCFAAWEEFLTAPRAELSNVRTMKAQLKRTDPDNTARWDALCAYETVLAALIGRLKEHQRLDLVTPKQLPAWLKNQRQRPPRGDGTHWVDHVPAHIKERVEALFNALPPTKRGKTKVPFERTIPIRQFKAARIKLIKELNLAHELAEQELDMARVPSEVERLTHLIDDITRAQFILDKHKRNTPLPLTWHGLVD
jgi:hypothetical protein